MTTTYDKDGAQIVVTTDSVSHNRSIRWEDCVVSFASGTNLKVDMVYVNASDQLVLVLEDESEITVTGGGVTDHGALTGLADDDHTQYWNDTRGNAAIATHASDVDAHHAKYTDAEALVQGQAAVATHEGLSDPHTGYRLESADHTHQSSGAQAGQLDHGLALTGLTDDDHTQYQLESEKGSANGYCGLDAGGLVAAADLPDAGAAAEGIVELAIASEVNAGTDAARAVTPDALAGSNFGIRYLQAIVFDFTTDNAIGNGKMYWHIPPALNGMNLIYCHAEVITAGTTGTESIQIANVTQAADMLSTAITIDTGETGSDTAATPYVIDTSEDDVATNDVIRVDIDAVHTTPAKGLIVTLGFQLP